MGECNSAVLSLGNYFHFHLGAGFRRKLFTDVIQIVFHLTNDLISLAGNFKSETALAGRSVVTGTTF